MQPRCSLSADEIALSSIDLWTGPHEEREGAFTLLRRERPISFHEEFEPPPEMPLPRGPGYWSVTRHADVITASRRSDVFCSGKGIQIPDLPRYKVLGGTLNVEKTSGTRPGIDGDLAIHGTITLVVETALGEELLRGTFFIHGVTWG